MNQIHHWRMTIATMCFAALVGLTALGTAQAGKEGLKIYTAEGDLEEVLFVLKDAIVSRSLTIDYTGHIGAMMERTNKEFGNPELLYKDAKFMTFCSVKLTRDMLDSASWNVGFCPYIVFLYELRAEPGKVYVGYRRPVIAGTDAEKAALMAVDKLLDEIVQEATEE